LKHSPFHTEAEIWEQLGKIEGSHGTRIVIYTLSCQPNSVRLELDVETDPHDIRIAANEDDDIPSYKLNFSRDRGFQKTDVPIDYSLRAYVSVLYLEPKVRFFLRGEEVIQKPIMETLRCKASYTYKPSGRSTSVPIVMGFHYDNLELFGMMLYSRNRLIKPYVRVGMQAMGDQRGNGVLGIVCPEHLEVTHNKQDFMMGREYHLLIQTLDSKLRDFWKANIPEYNKREGDVKRLRDYIKMKCQKEVNKENKSKRKKADDTDKAHAHAHAQEQEQDGDSDESSVHKAKRIKTEDDDEGPAPADDGDSDLIWKQCDNPDCRKWRRVSSTVAGDVMFFCHLAGNDDQSVDCSTPAASYSAPAASTSQPSPSTRSSISHPKRRSSRGAAAAAEETDAHGNGVEDDEEEEDLPEIDHTEEQVLRFQSRMQEIETHFNATYKQHTKRLKKEKADLQKLKSDIGAFYDQHSETVPQERFLAFKDRIRPMLKVVQECLKFETQLSLPLAIAAPPSASKRSPADSKRKHSAPAESASASSKKSKDKQKANGSGKEDKGSSSRGKANGRQEQEEEEDGEEGTSHRKLHRLSKASDSSPAPSPKASEPRSGRKAGAEGGGKDRASGDSKSKAKAKASPAVHVAPMIDINGLAFQNAVKSASVFQSPAHRSSGAGSGSVGNSSAAAAAAGAGPVPMDASAEVASVLHQAISKLSSEGFITLAQKDFLKEKVKNKEVDLTEAGKLYLSTRDDDELQDTVLTFVSRGF